MDDNVTSIRAHSVNMGNLHLAIEAPDQAYVEQSHMLAGAFLYPVQGNLQHKTAYVSNTYVLYTNSIEHRRCSKAAEIKHIEHLPTTHVIIKKQ